MNTHQTTEQLNYKNLCDTIYLNLRQKLLEGVYKPGQKLKQTELATQFGISRTPIRDALKKLEAEGLVSVQSSRCAVVPVLDLEEFQESYRIRAVLEELAARLAAPRITDAVVAQLRDMLDRMEKAAKSGDLAQWLQLDFDFHRTAFEAANSPRLLKLISSFWNATHHFRRAYVTLPGRIDRAERMHQRMLSAMEARDSELFGLLTRAHIEESLKGILEVQPSQVSHGDGHGGRKSRQPASH